MLWFLFFIQVNPESELGSITEIYQQNNVLTEYVENSNVMRNIAKSFDVLIVNYIIILIVQ